MIRSLLSATVVLLLAAACTTTKEQSTSATRPQPSAAVMAAALPDTADYRVDSGVLAANPDRDEIREEISDYMIRPCSIAALRHRGIKENAILALLPAMQKAVEIQVGNLLDLLVNQVKGQGPETRAAVYELNYESCLVGADVKGK